MIWYKIFGAGLLIASGVWTARRVNQATAGTIAELEAWQSLIGYIKSQVDCFALPIGEILSRASPSLLCACGWQGEGRIFDLPSLLENCALRDREGGEMVRRFCEEFGKRYREEECRACDATLALLGVRIERLRAHLPGQKRLCSTLCISGALAVVILLV